jgi:hypothetical protein
VIAGMEMGASRRETDGSFAWQIFKSRMRFRFDNWKVMRLNLSCPSVALGPGSAGRLLHANSSCCKIPYKRILA